MLATCLHFMKGTPYIYQGEELGMTNITFSDIYDYRDLDSINAYYELTNKGIFSKEEMLRYINIKSRDNARTPMQWDDSVNSGFSEHEPWIKVNPNYTEINAKEQVSRESSVFNYYKNLIKLRKNNPIIVYGIYDLLLEDSKEIYAYTRSLDNKKLLVVCNFTNEFVKFNIPDEFTNGKILICNYESNVMPINELKPYQSIVIEI